MGGGGGPVVSMVGLTPSFLLSTFLPSTLSSLVEVGGVDATLGLDSGAGGDGLATPIALLVSIGCLSGSGSGGGGGCACSASRWSRGGGYL